MSVSTQLRLISRTDVPADRRAPTDAPTARARPLRGRANTSRHPAARRAVHWQGRWRLDERTREVGRAGIASARAALAAVHGDDTDLRRAS